MQYIPDPRSVITAKASQDAWLALYAEWKAIHPLLMDSAPPEHQAALQRFASEFNAHLRLAYERRLQHQKKYPDLKYSLVSDWDLRCMGEEIWKHERALFSAARHSGPLALQLVQQMLQYAACEVNPSLMYKRAENTIELAGLQEAMQEKLNAAHPPLHLSRA